MKLKGVGIFALGTLFGLEGIKVLSSKDAKKVYTHCTAGVLRAKIPTPFNFMSYSPFDTTFTILLLLYLCCFRQLHVH